VAATHVSPYSGSWYPGDRAELAELIGRLWESSEQRTGAFLLANPLGFVVPHAGLVYSGTVAASAYRHIERRRPECIVLLGFAHRGCPPGLWIPDVGAVRTPLGEVRFDAEAIGDLTAGGSFRTMPEARLCDHSIEIQLPLIQIAAPESGIVPVYVSRLDGRARDEAAAALARRIRAGDILVASSDLTHYGSAFRYQPFPADSRVEERLRKLDFDALDAAGSLRPELFLRNLRETSATVCGYEPISLLLSALRASEDQGEIFQQVLDYQTSGEITGDFRHSVSYASAGYFRYSSFEVCSEVQALLLDLAKRTLQEYQTTGRRPIAVTPRSEHPVLGKRSAAFVTLHRDGQLRGCIGRDSSDTPLRESIPDLTMAAALDDTRFGRVTPDEIGIDIEISLLTPMKRIAERSDFRVNTHGALLQSGHRHGLLLPQVATERNWSTEQFFLALARKAGLDPDVYDDPTTRLRVFRAQVIH
jgi:MEMO1 family protein